MSFTPPKTHKISPNNRENKQAFKNKSKRYIILKSNCGLEFNIKVVIPLI